MKEHGDSELTLQLTFALKHVRIKMHNHLNMAMHILYSLNSCLHSITNFVFFFISIRVME